MPAEIDSRTRILHVVQSLGTGGLENGVVNLANRIDRRRFVLDVLCLRFIGELAERLTSESKVIYDPATSSSITSSIRSVASLCTRGRYQVVHTHGWATLLPGYIGGRIARVKVINGEHGTFFTDTRLRRTAQRILFRAVDLNCAVSDSLRIEMQEVFGHPASRVQVISNGVDVSRFLPTPSARAAIRRELGVAQGVLLLGTVGRLVPVKDYATLVTAFHELSLSLPGARLLIVGDGPELNKLKQIAEALGEGKAVIFTGNRDDVPSLMSAMDVFCLTSIREGLSNTLLEAHACGLPVLATATGGNGEVVRPGRTGFLFEVGDHGQLAELMITLGRNPQLRNQLGDGARKMAVQEFSIDRMVSAYEKIYAGILCD